MELTIVEALQQGITAHKAGKLDEAERLYRAILQSQPSHPDANHNLGVLAVSVNKVDVSLPFFKTALEANPKIEQFWLSYIDALIKDKQRDVAFQVLEDAKKHGVTSEQLNVFASQLIPEVQSTNLTSPSKEQLDNLLGYYQKGRIAEAEKLGLSLTEAFPSHSFSWKVLGALFGQTGRHSEALRANQKAVELSPGDATAHGNLGVALQELNRLKEAEASYKQALVLNSNYTQSYYNLGITLKELEKPERARACFTQALVLKSDYATAHYNLGITLQDLNRLEEAETSYKKAIESDPNFAEAHSNLGVTLQELGRLEAAEAAYKQAIKLSPDSAEAHSNLGVTLQDLGRLEAAEAAYKQAIKLSPDSAEAHWNLHGLQETVQSAEYWIDKCLMANPNYLKARLTKVALRYYQGERTSFDDLMKTDFKRHPYLRSFSWVFSLTDLPEVHFNKWSFFDAIFDKSITSRPFYEFGVWRASSFNYLIKVFKKGYGFDTFTGLPEDWCDEDGNISQKVGTYTANENVPDIKGGEFIVGKFEDTLPIFFSERRPVASVINFDADLYSSTICALSFSKSVIDKDTILIFDELIMNQSWENDEFRALNEFCSANDCTYDVIAISFLTKQVAVKLNGI